MDANPDGPTPLPNYITDGMLPHEYEPMRAARRSVHLALADYLSRLASYYEAQGLELTPEHIRQEILEPFRSMDYDTALTGLDTFRNRYDQFGLYTEVLNRLEDGIADMRRHEMPYWFPYGIDR